MKNFSENSFTDSVRQYLVEKHGVCYIGRFYYYTPDDKYSDDQDATYTLEWLENNQDKPYVMISDCATEAEFLSYVCKQITTTRFWLKKVFILKRTDKEGRT